MFDVHTLSQFVVHCLPVHCALSTRLLMDKFGYWAFDNHKFFSMGRPPLKVGQNDELKLHDEYTVKFLWTDSSAIDSEELPLTEEEQLLNIFKRKSMRNAKFSYFVHGEREEMNGGIDVIF